MKLKIKARIPLKDTDLRARYLWEWLGSPNIPLLGMAREVIEQWEYLPPEKLSPYFQAIFQKSEAILMHHTSLPETAEKRDTLRQLIFLTQTKVYNYDRTQMD